MSDRTGSDIERLWNWISTSTQNQLKMALNSESFYVGSNSFRHWFESFEGSLVYIPTTLFDWCLIDIGDIKFTICHRHDPSTTSFKTRNQSENEQWVFFKQSIYLSDVDKSAGNVFWVHWLTEGGFQIIAWNSLSDWLPGQQRYSDWL